MSVYLFKGETKKRKKRAELLPEFSYKVEEETEPPIGLIQGKTPMSTEEWRFSLALDMEEIPYIYQYTIYGGMGILGGQSIDFMVTLPPMPIPVFIQGRYWHTGKHVKDETLYIERLKTAMRGLIMPVKIVWDDEIPTLEAARMKVKEIFG